MLNHNTTGENIVTLDSVWMNMVRGIAISAVVIHHWLLFLPHQSSISIFYTAAELIHTVGGTAVHLFFILSGCGLTMSYFRRGGLSWSQWARRRFKKIIVPYWIVITFTFILVNLANYVSSEFVTDSYSWRSLFTYITFTRNFYSPGWGLNPTMWFMPVIVGLYVLFPVLVKVLEKYGVFLLLTISTLVTYGSITLCIVLEHPVSHQTALPLFYVIEFSLGMSVGYILCFHSHQFGRLVSFRTFCLGIGLYGVSWAMVRYWTLGDSYNDLFTAVGIYLVALFACRCLIRFSPQRSVKILGQVSKVSYLMYLIHGPLILFFVKPLLTHLMKSPMNSLAMIILGGIYCVLIFVLACSLSWPINSFAFHSNS